MSLKNKLAAGVFAVSAFAVAGFAQDANPEAKELTKDGGAKIERSAGMLGGGGLQTLLGGLGGMHQGLGIDLTDAQKAQIKEILLANKPEQAVLVEAKTILRAKFEGTATPAQEERLQVLKAQYSAQAIKVKAQIMAVLTTEQKAQIEQKKQEMKTRIEGLKQLMQEHHQTKEGK